MHVAVDDGEGGCAIGPSSRPNGLAYVEVLDDERKDTTTGFLLRALRWFGDRGIRAERVMTDRAIVAPLMEWMAPAPGIAMCHIGCCHTDP